MAKYEPHTTTLDDIDNTDTDSIELIIVVSSICYIALLLSVFIVKRKRNQLHETRSKTSKSPHSLNCIRNGLAVIIAIGDYEDDECSSPDLKDIYLRDLPIEKDIENLTELFNLLNYKIIPNKSKTYWTQHDIMLLLQKHIPDELFDDDNQLKYDGLIVCVSSHGTKNRIVTSDFKVIDKTAIHRTISGNNPKAREIPRIFIFDSCEGSAKREHEDDTELGKYIGLEHIKMATNWTTKTKNPDYKLVQVHAANIGFQAKIDSRFGSFLLYEFCERMKENMENEKHETLGDIFGEIQNILHDRGKQQTTNVFNNNTRYLQLNVNQKFNLQNTENMELLTQKVL